MNPFLHRFVAFVGFLLSVLLLVLSVRHPATYVHAVFAFASILFCLFSLVSPPKLGGFKW